MKIISLRQDGKDLYAPATKIILSCEAPLLIFNLMQKSEIAIRRERLTGGLFLPEFADKNKALKKSYIVNAYGALKFYNEMKDVDLNHNEASLILPQCAVFGWLSTANLYAWGRFASEHLTSQNQFIKQFAGLVYDVFDNDLKVDVTKAKIF